MTHFCLVAGKHQLLALAAGTALCIKGEKDIDI
jgi:hypothetical protein